MIESTARAGMTLWASAGLEALGVSDRMSTIFFCGARPGDRLTLLNAAYLFNVAYYASEVMERFVHDHRGHIGGSVYVGQIAGGRPA